MATDSIAEFMGVEVIPVATRVSTELITLAPEFRVSLEERLPRVVSGLEREGRVEAGSAGYVVDSRLNDAFAVVNRRLDDRVEVRHVTRAPASGIRLGDFVVPRGTPTTALRRASSGMGVDFALLVGDEYESERVSRRRVGLYTRYYGGNIDQGWTRWPLGISAPRPVQAL